MERWLRTDRSIAAKATPKWSIPVRIIPDETSGIDRIAVTAERRWKSRDESHDVSGFRIASFPSPADKERYSALVAIYHTLA